MIDTKKEITHKKIATLIYYQLSKAAKTSGVLGRNNPKEELQNPFKKRKSLS